MARATAVQAAFNGGEWSQRMAGRVDQQAYAAACEILENFKINAEGPADHRGGTYFISATKDSSKKARLVGFRFSTVQAYVLEFGDQYIRFYKDYGAILTGSPAAVVEVATPYLEADLFNLTFTQSADTLYIFHNGYAPRKLTRSSHVDWTLATVNFQPPATSEDGYTPTGIALTLGAVSGTGITVTAGSSVFLASDVGRQIKQANALLAITAFTSTTVVTADVVNAFGSTTVAASSWTLLGSPVASLTPAAATPVGSTQNMTLGANGWRAADVGRYLHVNGGFAVITGFSSATVVTARIIREMTGTTAANGGTWEIRDPAWSVAKGYPACGTFFQQRLWLGCSQAQPTTFWGSVTSEFENFALGGNDTDACDFTLDTDEVNAIQWLKGTRALLIGTTGGEFVATGSQTSPAITPDNIQVVPQSSRGSAKIQALLIGNVVMFVQRSRRKVRQYKYSFDSDAYASPEVTKRARHITLSARPGTLGGIVDYCYQQEPEGILWAARGDGQLIGLTFDDDEEVEGWQRAVLGGTFGAETSAGANDNWPIAESVCSIPSPDGGMDDLWLLVKRTINGSTFRSIEYMTDGLGDEDAQADGYFVDCGLTYRGAAVDRIEGFNHLIGQTAYISVNGASHPTRVVDALGGVDLQSAGTVVHVGLYRATRLRPMRIEAAGPDGSAQGKKKRIESLAIRFVRTLGGKVYPVNEDGTLGRPTEISARTTRDALGSAPPLFTGDKQVRNQGGWTTRGQVEIVQDQPLPMTVALIACNVAVNKV